MRFNRLVMEGLSGHYTSTHAAPISSGASTALVGVRRLNHQAFADELGQHEATGTGLLRDRFEEKSRYVIALRDNRVVGMLAIHDKAPYSIEQRLNDPAMLDAIPGRKLEVRLLAIDTRHRNGMVFSGLLGTMIENAFREGYDALLISGVVERVAMYRRLGFRELGPPVESGRARFVPMAMRLAEMPQRVREDIRRWRSHRNEG